MGHVRLEWKMQSNGEMKSEKSQGLLPWLQGRSGWGSKQDQLSRAGGHQPLEIPHGLGGGPGPL